MKKKLCSFALLIALVLALCPANAFATDEADFVSVVVTPPAIGAYPDFNPVLTTNVNYITGYEARWGIADTDIDLGPEDPFMAHKRYVVSIVLFADE